MIDSLRFYKLEVLAFALIGWLQWAFATWTHAGWRRREATQEPPSLSPSREEASHG